MEDSPIQHISNAVANPHKDSTLREIKTAVFNPRDVSNIKAAELALTASAQSMTASAQSVNATAQVVEMAPKVIQQASDSQLQPAAFEEIGKMVKQRQMEGKEIDIIDCLKELKSKVEKVSIFTSRTPRHPCGNLCYYSQHHSQRADIH